MLCLEHSLELHRHHSGSSVRTFHGPQQQAGVPVWSIYRRKSLFTVTCFQTPQVGAHTVQGQLTAACSAVDDLSNVHNFLISASGALFGIRRQVEKRGRARGR